MIAVHHAMAAHQPQQFHMGMSHTLKGKAWYFDTKKHKSLILVDDQH
jgi:hypothetical protein